MLKSTAAALYENAIFASLKLSNICLCLCGACMLFAAEHAVAVDAITCELGTQCVQYVIVLSICQMFLSMAALSPGHCRVATGLLLLGEMGGCVRP